MPEAPPPGASLLFLREEQIRRAQDMFYLAGRDLAATADPILRAHGLGRAHHRALHFIARTPGLPVSDLLATLGVTKQSLARVLAPLLARNLVRQAKGRADRRQRLLHLTDEGAALERTLFDCQRERLLAAYREAGGPAVEGFGRVMRAVMSPPAQKLLETNQSPASIRQSPGTGLKTGN
jgi:DNA-binding MarR family transcriptional regulator